MSRVSHPDCLECGVADDIEKLFERWWCEACEICIDKHGEEIEEPECEECEDDGDVEVDKKCWKCTYEDCLHGLDSEGRIIPECQECEDYQDVGYKNGSLWCEHCEIDIVDETEERQAIKERMDRDPEIRLTEYLDEMRKRFEHKGPINIYVAELKKSVIRAGKRHKYPKFPDLSESVGKYPKTHLPKDSGFKGCVYVGLTHYSVEERFENHMAGIQAGKKYIQNFGISRGFHICVKPLTDEFGFEGVNKFEAERVEAWLGWALYKCGYWVWGPHKHKEEDFLEEYPFW